jgi:hypothetical protein
MAQLRSAANVPVGGTTTRSTTQLNQLGAKFYDSNGAEYTYIKAEGTILAGSPVSVDILTNGLTEWAASASVKGFEGIAQAAFADEEYGFICTQGRCLALVPSGVALGDPLSAGNAALSATLTNAVKHVTVQEAPVLLSGTTQLKYVYIH